LRSHIISVTAYFLHHNQLLADLPLYSKNGTTTRTEQRVALLYNPLDILRIEIAATNDDEILEATCDKKLIIKTKTQISSA
jgi:hypothetical protein